MISNLTGLGFGIITLAVIIVVGTTVLVKFGQSVAGCPSIGGEASTYNTTLEVCTLNNGSATATPTGAGYINTAYLTTQLGQSGLAGWVPAIIALVVGLTFLGAFMIGKGKKKGRY